MIAAVAFSLEAGLVTALLALLGADLEGLGLGRFYVGALLDRQDGGR